MGVGDRASSPGEESKLLKEPYLINIMSYQRFNSYTFSCKPK